MALIARGQITITTVNDGITVLLSPESYVFAAGTSAAKAGSVAVSVTAHRGSAQLPVTIGTITGQPGGMTTAISSNGTTSAKFTATVTTSMTTAAGKLTVPLTIDGMSVTKAFSYSLAKTGNTGATGATGKDAFNVILSPGTLSFDTATDGSITASGQVKVTATLGTTAATVTYPSQTPTLVNLSSSALVTSGSGTTTLTITMAGSAITKTSQTYKNGSNTSKTIYIPATSGSAQVKVTLTSGSRSETRTITIPFTVNLKSSLATIYTNTDSIVATVVSNKSATDGSISTMQSNITANTNAITSEVSARKSADNTLQTSISSVQQTASSLTSKVSALYTNGINLLQGSQVRETICTSGNHLYASLTAGKTYTLSVRGCITSAAASAGGRLNVTAYHVKSDNTWETASVYFTETSWAEKSVTFKVTNGGEWNVYGVLVNSSGTALSKTKGYNGYIYRMQLEEGGTATPWQANPADNKANPDLVSATYWQINTSSSATSVVLPDGTTGTARYQKCESSTEFQDIIKTKSGVTKFVKASSRYTISCWAKGSGTFEMYFVNGGYINGSVSSEGVTNNLTDGQTTFTLTADWRRYEATITTGTTASGNDIRAARILKGGEAWVWGWKVEAGGAATDTQQIETTKTALESTISQTKSTINASITNMQTGIEAAGIHLNGANSTITLNAEKTVITGGEFDAGNATFKNLTVKGYLSSGVDRDYYQSRNSFLGDNGILNRVFQNTSDMTTTTEFAFLPPDYDFIGSHIMLFVDNTIDNTGLMGGSLRSLTIYAGRSFMKHAYMSGAGTSSEPFYVASMNVVTAGSRTGAGIRTITQDVLRSAAFFARYRVSSNSTYYAPNSIKISNGFIEFVGIPAYAGEAYLYPYSVSIDNDSTSDDKNTHLLKFDTSGNLTPVKSSGAMVQDDLHKKLLALYTSGGESALPDGVTAVEGAYVEYYNGSSSVTAQMTVFKLPLCRWYPTNTSVQAFTSSWLSMTYAAPNTGNLEY